MITASLCFYKIIYTMHIVKLCLPWAPDLWKKWSRLKATRGRYPILQ